MKKIILFSLFGISLLIVIIGFFDQKKSEDSVFLTNSSNLLCRLSSDSIHLSILVKEHPILIYRVNEFICEPCFDNNLNYLEEILTPQSNLVLLGSYFTERNLYVLKKNKRIEFSVYNIPFDALDIDYLGDSYYFILHPTMEVTDIFKAESILTESTMQYFQSIKQYIR